MTLSGGLNVIKLVWKNVPETLPADWEQHVPNLKDNKTLIFVVLSSIDLFITSNCFPKCNTLMSLSIFKLTHKTNCTLDILSWDYLITGLFRV